MRGNVLIAATAHTNGIITLEGLSRNELIVAGSSLGNLVYVGKEYKSTSFSFSIKQGEKGMVAVIVYEIIVLLKDSEIRTFKFFFPVEWEEGQEKPFIDLQNQWVAEDPARQGCFYYEGLEVAIDGTHYSSSSYSGEKDGKFRVNDANLLCRYMDSKITAGQFRESLDLPAKEQSLREKLRELRLHVVGLEAENEMLNRQQAEAEPINAARDSLLAAKDTEANNWKEAAGRLKTAVKKQWFKRPSVDRAMRMFPAE